MYSVLLTHIGLAYVSLLLLLSKGVLSARMVDWRQFRLLKFAPHIVDTLLLISGLTVFYYFGFSWAEMWIWVKLLFLVLYIVFATKAFKKGKPFSLKHFLLAVVSFMLVMLVAVTY